MSRHPHMGLILVVAGLSLLTLAISGCGVLKDKAKSAGVIADDGGDDGDVSFDPPKGPTGLDLTGFDLTLNSYESCDAIQKDVHDFMQRQIDDRKAQQAYYESRSGSGGRGSGAKSAPDDAVASAESADSGGDGGASDNSAPESDSITNVQEKGVDEADFAKLGTDHFYVQHGQKIEVLDRASLAAIGQLDLGSLKNVTLYAEADRLVAIGIDVGQPVQTNRYCYEGDVVAQYDRYSGCYNDVKPKTIVRTYAATKGQVPTVANERSYEDAYTDSRFVAGKVVLIFSTSLPVVQQKWDAETAPDQPVTIADGKVSGIACTLVSKPYVKDGDFRLTKIVTFDSRDLAKEDQAAATFGGGDQLYMTSQSLYLAKQGMTWIPWSPEEAEGDYQAYYKRRQILQETLVVTKIGFITESGAVGPLAVGAVAGRVKDQWAFKEYAQGVLAVATTTWAKFKPETPTEGQHNHLWIMQHEGQALTTKAAINDFGPKEDIRAARYLGNMAYIVTFEKTDPLFAFDLTDPLAPKQLSELKIPGFSMYLHPTSEGRLVGVGYDADDQGSFSWYQGVQLSLFDVSNPLDLKRLDVKVLGDRGSYSDITGDHKAFYENKEHHLIGIPLVEMVKSPGSQPGGSQQGDILGFTGAILYDLSGDTLAEKARVTHKDLIDEACQKSSQYGHWWQETHRSLDVNRLYTIDGRLVTVSRFGVRSHDLAAPEAALTTTKFAGDEHDCSTSYGRY